MSWFNRHLNLTLVLSWIFELLVFLSFGSDYTFNWGSVPMQVTPPISTQAFGGWTDNIRWLGPPAIILVVTGWHLRKKNRSLLPNLLVCLLFPPMALFLLFFKNKSENAYRRVKNEA